MGSRVVRVADAFTWRVALLTVIFAFATAACSGSSEDAVDAVCAGLETVADSTGLISQDEAEKLATERLAMSAPEVTGTDVERVWASCLTTLQSYEQDLLEGRSQTNPEVLAPDTRIWLVEVKGISRPAGISTASANSPYRYAAEIIDARTGQTIGGSRRYEPLLEPSP